MTQNKLTIAELNSVMEMEELRQKHKLPSLSLARMLYMLRTPEVVTMEVVRKDVFVFQAARQRAYKPTRINTMKLHYDKDHQHVFVDTCSKEFAAYLAATAKRQEVTFAHVTQKFITTGPSLDEIRKQGGWRS